MFDPKKSITWTVTSRLLLAVTLLLGILGSLVYQVYRGWMLDDFKARQVIITDQLADDLKLPLWNFDEIQIRRVLESALNDHDLAGATLQDSGTPPRTFSVFRGPDNRLLNERPDTSTSFSLLTRDIASDGKSIGTLSVYSSSENLADRLHRSLVGIVVGIVILDTALVAILYWMLWHTVIQPIRAVGRYAVAVSAGSANPINGRFIGEIEVLHRSIEETMHLLETRYLELGKSEARYKLLAENVGDVIWTIDQGGHITYISPSIQRLTGAKQDELIGKYFTDVLAPDSIPIAKNILEQGLANADRGNFTTRRVEIELRAGPQTTKWTEMLIEAVRDSSGRLQAFLGVARDIEERRKMEQALRQAENKYRGIFENSVLDLYQATPDGRYITANPALARMLGYSSPAELLDQIQSIGQQVFVNPGQREELVARLIRDGIVEDFECEFRRKDETRIWVSADVRAERDPTGKILYFEGSISDITKRKHAEESAARLAAQLQQAQKLEAIGTLASGIAHDFNNILAIIMGCAEMIREDTAGQTQSQEDVATLLKATERGKNLVAQILAFCRKTQQEHKQVELSSIVREALKFLRSTIPANIQIESRIEEGLPAVRADPTQIYQVLMNLCTNAVHAMSGTNGRLTVSLQKQKADEHFVHTHPGLRPIDYVCLSVSDTGHGMDKATVARIFEPFFTTKAQGQGTGLGLAVVHGIISNHDGGIFVYSKPGEGTVFRVYLPAYVAPSSPTENLPPAPIRGHGERILYVDDETALCTAVERTLQNLGYAPTSFSNAKTALACLQTPNLHFDLIITDLAMPGMTGLEFAAEALRLHPATPIVLLSGYAGSQTIESIRALGLSDLAIKPLTGTDLANVVARNLSPDPSS